MGFSIEKWPNFEYIMSENDLNMIDLVLNHLNQPLGPP